MKTTYKSLVIVFLMLAAATMLSSCAEDVITIDLNTTAPKIVIEGTVTKGAGPHTVRITKTTDYFKPADYLSVTGATVVISDSEGNKETLTERDPGVYVTAATVGKPGIIYTLDVAAEGVDYKASSTMMSVGYIDSLALEIENESNDSYIVHCYFQDTVNVKEYYRLKIYINNKPLNDYFMYQDRLTDGNYLDAELWFDEQPLRNGDIIIVETQTIDRGVYQYFSTLYDVSASMADGSGMLIGTPANPVSNISNGALGYFAAYTAEYDTLVVNKSIAIKN